MITSKAHALIGTTAFTACIVESVYNGEYTDNRTAKSSGYLKSREEAQKWALRELGSLKPLLRMHDHADGTRTEVEFWAEISEWSWREITLPGVLDADEVEDTRQYGYIQEGDAVEWTEPEKP